MSTELSPPSGIFYKGKFIEFPEPVLTSLLALDGAILNEIGANQELSEALALGQDAFTLAQSWRLAQDEVHQYAQNIERHLRDAWK